MRVYAVWCGEGLDWLITKDGTRMFHFYLQITHTFCSACINAVIRFRNTWDSCRTHLVSDIFSIFLLFSQWV